MSRPLSRAVMRSLCYLAALLLAGCSNSGNSIKLKTAGGEHDVPVKSGSAFAVTKTFTDINGKITTAASYRVYVANYDLDGAQFGRSLEKALATDEAKRVVFSLVGEQGTNEKTPLKPGTYSATADKFNRVEEVSIVTRKNGQDDKQFLERSAISGDVKVASVSGDSVTGEIDLTTGETTIKGPFVAKILVRQ